MDANQLLALAAPSLLVAVTIFILTRWTTKRDTEQAKQESEAAAANARLVSDLARVEADLRGKIARRDEMIESLGMRHDRLAAECREERRALSERIVKLEEYQRLILEKGCDE